MVNDEFADSDFEGPRRTTFEPPDDDVVYTNSSSVTEEDSTAESPERPSLTSYLPAPVRTYRTEEEIVAEFDRQGAGSTGDMIEELQKQIFLRGEEEFAFSSWAAAIRRTREDRAEGVIAHEREITLGSEDDAAFSSWAVSIRHAQEDDVDGIIAHERGIFDAAKPEALIFDALGLRPEEGEADEPPQEPEPGPEVALEELSPKTAVETSEVTLDVTTQNFEFPEDDTAPPVPTEDTWPLSQEAPEAGVVVPPAPLPDGEFQRPWALFSTWGFALIPLVALTAGATLVAGGLGLIESLAVGGVVGLTIAWLVGALSKAKNPGVATFGTYGTIVPSVLMMVVRVAVVAGALWWAERTLVMIGTAARWWTGDEWFAHPGAAVGLGMLALIPALVGATMVRVTLWISAGLGVLGAAAVVFQTSSFLTASPEWAWQANAVDLLAMGSLLLAGALLMLVPLAVDMARLKGRRSPRALRSTSAVGATLPLVAFLFYTVWVVSSTPSLGDALLENPVVVLGVGLGTWYPIPAVLFFVLPFVGFLSIGLTSLGSAARELFVPGSKSVNPGAMAAVDAVVVGAVVALAIVFSAEATASVLGLLPTLGVVIAAWAGATAVDAILSSKKTNTQAVSWRLGPLLGVLVAIGLGLGLVSSGVSWLSWQGYLVPLLERAGMNTLFAGNLGVFVALGIAALVSALAALPAKKPKVKLDG